MPTVQPAKTAVAIVAFVAFCSTAEAVQRCEPIQHNRAIEGVTLTRTTSGSASLQVSVSAAVSGSKTPRLDADLIVRVNGRPVSSTPVDFTVPASAGPCDFVGDTLSCAGACGTNPVGQFTCKGLVISGGMYCGCSVLKAPEAGPVPLRPGDRLSVSVVAIQGGTRELFQDDDRLELDVVSVRVRPQREDPATGTGSETVTIELAEVFDLSGIDVETLRLNGSLPALSGKIEGKALEVQFRRSDVRTLVGAAGYDQGALTITGRFKNGVQLWGSTAWDGARGD